MKYNVYFAEDFGFLPTPSIDESLCVFVPVNEHGIESDGQAQLLYVYNNGFDEVPKADTSLAETFTQTERKELISPVFQGVEIGDDEALILPAMPDLFVLSRQQSSLLCEPGMVRAKNGTFISTDPDDVAASFRKDVSLDSIEPKRLDMRKLNAAIEAYNPLLGAQTHVNYGNKRPMFPNAKNYIEHAGRDKIVVFMTEDQVRKIDEHVIKDQEPWYRQQDWTEIYSKDVYGVCLIDDRSTDYSVRLVSVATVKEMWAMEREAAVVKKTHEPER